MNLYIVRHGHADNGVRDSERMLTGFGRQKLLETIPKWKSYISNIDLIFSSPLSRALETAELIHQSFNVETNLIIDQSLQPGMNLPIVIANLMALNEKNIMIVSHMPDVSDLVSLLTTPNSFSYPFTPGMLVAVEFENKIKIGGGKMKLMLPEMELDAGRSDYTY